MSSFLDLVDAVGSYYGTGSDQWRIIAQQGINSPEALQIISQVPGVNVTTSNSGKILGYDFDNAFPSGTPASSAINSNTQGGMYGSDSFSSNIPASASPPDATHPNGSMSSGAKLTGVGRTVATVADRLSLAVIGVSLGTKLGKLIDQGIYNFNPAWFDENFPTMNPETWDDIATTEGGKNFIRGLFGLENDSATMYLDERLLAYTYMTLLENGAYAAGEQESELINPSDYNLVAPVTGYRFSSTANTLGADYYAPVETYPYMANLITSYNNTTYGVVQHVLVSENPVEGCIFYRSDTNNLYVFTKTPVGAWRRVYYTLSGSADGTIRKNWNGGSSTANNPITTYENTFYKVFNNTTLLNPIYNISSVNPLNTNNNDIGYALLFGDLSTPQALPGLSNNPQATTQINPNTLINPTTGAPVTPNDDPADVLQALQTQYPDLFNGSVYTDVPQPDGTTETITYIPVPYPNGANTSQPTTDTTPNVNPQTNPQVTPSNRPNAAEDIATEVTQPVNNAPDTGTGSSPSTPAPTGGASSLWAVYNPTQAQVDDFGAWLWSSNFVEQIKKLFSDPMQGIIGLHKIFATPATGASQNIKVGYLDSGVSSAIVTNQYTDVDCGTVNVAEYFGNVFDYDGTNIRAYLPFIGIVDLSTSDVMRGSVHIVYHVDVITGACLADVIVSRDGAGGVLYQYSGDAAVRYPVSSGSYMGIVNGVLAVVGGVVGVASGGAALPAVMGAVGGLMNSHTSVKHSGSFSGAAGAMGAKIPYLIIERPQTAVADGFVNYQGIGDNRIANVGSLAGYFKMSDVHTDGVVGATIEEINQITSLLEGGVIQ